MIIIFHSLFFLVRHLVKIYRAAQAINKFQSCQLIGNEVKIHTNCIVTDSLDLRFDPPLYKQRYATIQQILLNITWKSQIRKVADFGCSELNFFCYLKHLHDINEIVFVDIDEGVLNDNVFKIHPLTVDYLKRRPNPLRIHAFAGSVCQPDSRLLGCDAIIAIELIEHLYPDTLEAFPYNVFHYVKPLLAIFTTPNYEFNTLFPGSKQFRHIDHKFEWTREQFQSWALNITVRFPNYTVQFDGIGPGPKGSESVGCCTQIAIFLRHSVEEEQLSEVPRSCREIQDGESNIEICHESHGICTHFSYGKQIQEFSNAVTNESNYYYKEIEYIEYPCYIDTRTPEQRMLDEVRYKIYSSANSTSRFYNEKKDIIEYPLYELVSNEDGCFTTITELSKLLQKENFTIEECIPCNSNEKSLCVVFNLSMDDHSSSPSSNGNNSDDNKNTYKVPWNVTAEETDWEAEYNQSVKINNDTNEKQKELEKKKDNNNTNENTNEQKVTYQFHSTLPNTSESREDLKKERNNSKRQSNSHSKLPGTSAMHNTDRVPKKGTNIKNKDMFMSSQSSSKESDIKKRKNDNNMNNSNNIDGNDKKTYKKNLELKVQDSAHSQASSTTKNNRNVKNAISNNAKSIAKGKILTTTSLKRFPIKTDDSSLASTSDLKKKKKVKKPDEDKEDIKALTECIIYNTLNNIPEIDENGDEPSSSCAFNNINNNTTLEISNSEVPTVAVPILQQVVGHEIMNQILTDTNFGDGSNRNNNLGIDEDKTKDITSEPINQELNHASREALFDPNSEIDMLEEFEIPPAPPAPTALEVPTSAQHNVIFIGLHANNDEEAVVLPDNADPFPNWLLQLLGANVEEGESHDEPHFYCQGDGIGVHPSIIEVEIDEEESSSDSSSSHDEAEAEHTISDSGVVQLPSDDVDNQSTTDDTITADVSVPLSLVTPLGSTSAADSTDEFFDSIEENLSISDRQNFEINKKKEY